MSSIHDPVRDEELHAYVDGTLSEPRRIAVEQWLEQNEAAALKVSDYFALNNLFHERYDSTLNEPIPERFKASLKAMPAGRGVPAAANWSRYAGLAAMLVLGVSIGVAGSLGLSPDLSGSGKWIHLAGLSASGQDTDIALAKQAAIAHVVYAPEVTRPVEVGADREQELVQWLSSRLGTDVRPPILTNSGYALMGGRLLPSADGPIAQFMYHNAAGERITLCISHRKVATAETAFKHYTDGDVNVFYWVDGDFGYAVSGGADRSALLGLSHDVYSQLTARR